MARSLKFGWILVREGIINRNQLANILRLKEKHKDQLCGELATKYFSIPEKEIETAFAQHILLPFAKECFVEQLIKNVKIKDLNLANFITEFTADIKSLNRYIIKSSTLLLKNNFFECDSGHVELKITCTLGGITLKVEKDTLVKLSDINIELNVPKYNFTVLDPQIYSEAKIKLIQAYKTCS